MNTATIFAEVFKVRTTGRKAIYKVVNLTLDAVKLVLNGELIKSGTDGASEDLKNGFLREKRNSGFYGGNDGYIPTTKGYKAILKELEG